MTAARTRYISKIAIILPLMAFSFGAWAEVQCGSLEQALQVEDDVCESIAMTAERCFAQLNAALQATPGYSAELHQDYSREIETLKTQFLPKLSSIGNDGGLACLNQTGEVKVWIKEMEKDRNTLVGRSGRSRR